MAKQNVELKFTLKDGVTSGLSKIGKGVEEIDKKLGKVAVAAGAATVALAAVGAGAALVQGLKDVASFEEQLARIGATAGASADQMAKIKTAIEETEAGSKASLQETAAAFQVLTAEGLTAEQSINALSSTLNLATAANLSTTEAAAALAATLDQFGISANNAASVTDVLATAAIKGGTGTNQLLQALEQVGPTARNSGVSLEETAAALALLAQNGIEGGKAGGALRMILSGLQDPASAFSKALSAIGISSRDFGTVVDQLGTKGASAQTAIQALGARGAAALQALVREGGGALNGLTQDMAEADGAAASLAKRMEATLGVSFDKLGQAFEALRRQFFEPISEPLQKEFDLLAQALRDFAESPEFEQLREAFRVAFEEGLQFVRNFIAEFDFQAALKSVQEFTNDAGEKLRGFAQTADEVASAIRGAANAIGAVFNTLQTVVAASVGAIAQTQATLLAPFAAVSDSAEEMQRVMQDVADNAFEQVKIQAAEVGANVSAMADEFGHATNATDTASEAAASAASKMRELSADEERLANNAAKFAEVQRQEAAAIAEAANAAASGTNVIAEAQQKLVALEQSIGEQLAGGASAASVAEMVTQANALRATIAGTGQAATDAGNKIKQAGDQGASAFAGAASAASSASSAIAETGEAAQQSATMAAEGTASLSGVTAALFSKYSALSEAAGKFFRDTQKAANFGSQSLESYGNAIEVADRATQQAFDNQVAGANAAIAKLQEFAQSGKVAGDVASTAFFASEQALDGMESAIRQGIGGFELLDRQTLSNLQAAIDAARQKTKQLSAEARQAVAELQNIGDTLEEQKLRDTGNEEEIARREFERKMHNIEEIEKRAGAAGAAGAERAKRLAREELDRAIAAIQERKAAELEAAREVADERIVQDQRVNQAAVAASQSNAGGTTRASSGGGKGGSFDVPTRAGDQIALNIMVEKFQSVGKDKAQLEEFARTLLPEIERILRRRR